MTQRAPSDRALSALKASGMEETPISSLERVDALFVLTPSTLLYQDGGGTRRVTLRDLTRIHSDQDGMLRVETPAGTALTASLLGFDPAQVQQFFGRVRATTYDAKEMKASPLPTGSAEKTFGTPPTPSVPAAQPLTPPLTPPLAPGLLTPPTAPKLELKPERPVGPPPGAAPDLSPSAGLGATPLSPPVTAPGELREQPAAPKPGAPTTPPEPVQPPAAPPPTPVVISSSAFSPTGSASGNKPAAKTPQGAEKTARMADGAPGKAPERPAVPAAPTPTVNEPRPVTLPGVTAPAPLAPVTPAPVAPVVPGPVYVAQAGAAGALSALARQAEVTDGLVGRLRFLGAVLFLGSLALAYFQFVNLQRLAALWTLLAGGVGTIALLALADITRLLTALARSLGRAGGAVDAD